MFHQRYFLSGFLFSIPFLISCASTKSMRKIESYLQDQQSGKVPRVEDLDYYCHKGASAACAIRGQPVGKSHSLAVMQGMTDKSSAQFVVLAPKDADLVYAVMAVEGGAGQKVHRVLRPQASFQRGFSNWRLDHVSVDSLIPGRVYEFWIIGPDGSLWDRRDFQSLDTAKATPRIIVGSCMDDGFRQEQIKSWEKIRARRPDILFLIGDNVYVKKYVGLDPHETDPEILWNRYVETRNLLDLFRWSSLVPVVAVWDDNDFGSNDGDRTYAYKADSKAVFDAFFPRREIDGVWQNGPGVAGRLTAFGQEFIFFDDRSFRTPNRQDIPGQSHFGDEQEKWAWAGAGTGAKKGPLWLISGDQFFGGYHSFESYEGNHPQAFGAFKAGLKRLDRPFVFVSGDRHLVELMKIGRKDVGIDTYELTTSPIHARAFSQNIDRNPNSRRIAGFAGPYNFMEIEPHAADNRLNFKVKAWGADEGILFEKDLTVSH
jgi:alkaline phosphatase D